MVNLNPDGLAEGDSDNPLNYAEGGIEHPLNCVVLHWRMLVAGIYISNG
jgi:hypothetical protein